jgi:hypothetical protein
MKFHTDEQKAELLGRGKPAWYTRASVQASTELPVSVSSVASRPAPNPETILDADESDGEVPEVRPLKSTGLDEDNDDVKSSRAWHEVNVQTMSVADKLVLEASAASYKSTQEFFQSDFGAMIGRFVRNASANNGKVWLGPLVHLPETAAERKRVHDAAGNTTFPCPADLVAYLERRPTLTAVNEENWRQPSYPREQDVVSEASYESCSSDDSLDSIARIDREDERSFLRFTGWPNSRRFRMP